MQVFLSPTSFLSMTVAAVEVYPRETVGVLIGLRGDGKIWVEYALPIQTAKREEDEVTWKPTRETRIRDFMIGSTGLQIVGQFHSHPYAERDGLFRGMNRLGASDLKSWGSKMIEMVVGVVKNGGLDRNGKRLEWTHLRRGSLQGAVGAYAMKLTAWFSIDRSTKRPSIAFIRCPFATGIDR